MALLAFGLPLALALSSCDGGGASPTPKATPTAAPTYAVLPTAAPLSDAGPYEPTADERALLEAELRGAFDFFYGTANADPASPGYGLIPDRMPGGEGIASIASVGYGLAALCIGAERGFAPRADLEARALGTLVTLRDVLQQEHGFFFHFLDRETGQRAWSSEVSVIDTAICMDGVLLAGAYFGGEVQAVAEAVYDRVDWPWYASAQDGKRFSMGYTPEDGFSGAWDMTAEQFMMYFLAAGSPTHPLDGGLFYGFSRPADAYGGLPTMVRSPAGSLFVYEFSHAWFDLRHTADAQGVDWFRNSTVAALASRRYAMDQSPSLGTGALDWGFTASDGPRGYEGGYGSKPGGGYTDGTVAPYGAAGAVVFTPEQSIAALRNMKETLGGKGLWGTWGFQDAYNRSGASTWIGPDVIGIDKGVSMLMIENLLTGFVWRTMAAIPAVQAGMLRCGVTSASEVLLSSFEEGADGAAPVSTGRDAATAVAAAAASVAVDRSDAARGAGSLRVDASAGGSVSFALADGIAARLGDGPVAFRLAAKDAPAQGLALALLDAGGATVAAFPAAEASRTPAAGGDGWTDWSWTVRGDGVATDLSRVAAVRVTSAGAGTFRIDDLAFASLAPRIDYLLADGARKVGETARFVWQASDPLGRPVVVRSVRWVVSDAPTGPWTPIPGATGAYYQLRPEDTGRYVAVEVSFDVGEGAAQIRLDPVTSTPTGLVLG